jgi:N-methylhydantoinase B
MPNGGEFLWYSYQSGGCGARHGADGNSGEWHLMANSKNESMELWEVRYPVEFLGYGLVPDSGGTGKWRGGLGTERRLRVTVETRLTGFSDHHGIGARGVNGGRPGLPNGFAVIRDGREYDIASLFGLPSRSKFSNVTLHAGDIFVSRQGGGGGYGDPHTRDESLIRRDLQEGYMTRVAAESEYGYRSPGGDD